MASRKEVLQLLYASCFFFCLIGLLTLVIQGPAVVFALGMLQNAPGSRIILCTDGTHLMENFQVRSLINAGLANVGLGNLESKDRDAVAALYKRMAETAKLQSVGIDVISIRTLLLTIFTL